MDDDAARWGETIVWRVTPAPESAQGVVEDAATVIARMPRTTVLTRLSRTPSGALAFVTARRAPDGVAVELRVTEGSTVTTSYTAQGVCGREICFDWLAGPTFVNPGVYLSPDGSSLIMAVYPGIRGRTTRFYWMNTDPADRALRGFGRTAEPPSLLEPTPIYDQFAHGGAAWLPGAVALWTGGDILFPGDPSGTDLVQVFDATPPREFRYEYVVDALPGAARAPSLVGAIAVGDHLVLTTTTGVRILDATGRLVGGTDPFHCGATTTAAAEQVGPSTVAVGVGDTVITFEVGP